MDCLELEGLLNKDEYFKSTKSVYDVNNVYIQYTYYMYILTI